MDFGVGMLSYMLMSLVLYLVKLVKFRIAKRDKPLFDISPVSIIVSIFFCFYFFVPATL